MVNPAKLQSLQEFADRVAYVVTDLNGLISSIVNDEITVSDFDGDLTELADKLNEVEGAVSELTKLFWK
jgi:hypothetical protein